MQKISLFLIFWILSISCMAQTQFLNLNAKKGEQSLSPFVNLNFNKQINDSQRIEQNSKGLRVSLGVGYGLKISNGTYLGTDFIYEKYDYHGIFLNYVNDILIQRNETNQKLNKIGISPFILKEYQYDKYILGISAHIPFTLLVNYDELSHDQSGDLIQNWKTYSNNELKVGLWTGISISRQLYKRLYIGLQYRTGINIVHWYGTRKTLYETYYQDNSNYNIETFSTTYKKFWSFYLTSVPLINMSLRF